MKSQDSVPAVMIRVLVDMSLSSMLQPYSSGLRIETAG